MTEIRTTQIRTEGNLVFGQIFSNLNRTQPAIDRSQFGLFGHFAFGYQPAVLKLNVREWN